MDISRTYKIETSRLIIRCYEPTDAPKLLDAIMVSIDHLRPWMPWLKQEPHNLESKVNLVRKFRGNFDLGVDYIFGVFDKTEKKLIGSTGLHTRLSKEAREIGYWINYNYINNGFAFEAVSALVKIGFEIEQLSRIEIHCDPHNVRSKRIPEKLGFKCEAILKNRRLNVEGNSRDVMIWTMFKEDYEQSPAKMMTLKAYDIIGREIVN